MLFQPRYEIRLNLLDALSSSPSTTVAFALIVYPPMATPVVS